MAALALGLAIGATGVASANTGVALANGLICPPGFIGQEEGDRLIAFYGLTESEILKMDRNRNNQLCFALVSGGDKTVLVDDLV
jgi:hypothetical protein